jgi:hypothetical protein
MQRKGKDAGRLAGTRAADARKAELLKQQKNNKKITLNADDSWRPPPGEGEARASR